MRPHLLLLLQYALVVSTQAFFAPFSLTCGGGIQHRLQGHMCSQDVTSIGPARATISVDRPRPTSCDRRAFFSEAARTVAGVGLAAGVLVPQRAVAANKEKPAEEEIPVDWKAEFNGVRAAMKPVLNDLRTLSAEGDWVGVMSNARDYDLSFRKIFLGNVRKKLPKDLKDDAMAFRNSMTFDLIAINKAARAENKERALEVCDILESDINKFLSLEGRL